MRLVGFISALVAVAVVSGCGSDDSFKIRGRIAGGGSATVELLYCPDGAARRVSVNAVDGKFSIEGQSRQPALGVISVGGRERVATVIVQNGDRLECVLTPDKPFGSEVKGTKSNELLNGFMRSNAEALEQGDSERINGLVAQFVGANRRSTAATALVVSEYVSAGHEVSADSLMGVIDPEARSAGLLLNFTSLLSAQLSSEALGDIIGMSIANRNDSVVRYNPYRQSVSLLAFVGSDRAQRDSVVGLLRGLRRDFSARRVAVIEVSTAGDSAEWKRSTAGDSATWTQTWTPSGVASPQYRRMAVARVPFFIVADSTGHQLHRGSSVGGADAAVRGYLKNK